MVSLVTWLFLLVNSFFKEKVKKKKKKTEEAFPSNYNNSLPGRGDCNLHHLGLLKKRLARVILVSP